MPKTIEIDPDGEEALALWRLTEEVAEALNDIPWVLVGGQMVELIEREAGGRVGRRTVDMDVLIDVRRSTKGLRAASAILEGIGFEAQISADGLGYRFVRGDAMVDVLAPDHLGDRVDLVTSPPGMTVEITGGTQALLRRRNVTVLVAGRTFVVPVPTVAGALVIKTSATLGASRSQQRKRHLRDVARVLAVVDDIETVRRDLAPRERGALRRLAPFLTSDSPSWTGIPNAVDGVIALERLAES